jgi:hypothetical protein
LSTSLEHQPGVSNATDVGFTNLLLSYYMIDPK